tara:strand:+ start:60 stop:377 length:318 start_codon:yes stop_codon:yes gene_type:complete
MNRKEILEKASSLVMNDRAKQHGDIVINHGNIARLWSAYLTNKTRVNINISEQDVALLLSLFKVGRTQNGNHTDDNYVDGAAYMAIGGEIVNRKLQQQAEDKSHE